MINLKSVVTYKDFEDAREYARRLKLNKADEWFAFVEGRLFGKGKKPYDVPARPDSYYLNKGWTGWEDWLGSNRREEPEEITYDPAPIQQMSYQPQAPIQQPKPKAQQEPQQEQQQQRRMVSRKMVETVTLTPEEDVIVPPKPRIAEKPKEVERTREVARPKEVIKPRVAVKPVEIEEEEEESDLLKKIVIPPVRTEKFKTAPIFDEIDEDEDEYEEEEMEGDDDDEEYEDDEEESSVPASELSTLPHRRGKKRGRKKKAFRTFAQSRSFARSLNLRSVREWKLFCKGEMPDIGRLPEDVPKSVNIIYQHDGWISWNDFLGK